MIVSREQALSNAAKAREKAWNIRGEGGEEARKVAEAYDREAKGWEDYVEKIDQEYRDIERSMEDTGLDPM